MNKNEEIIKLKEKLQEKFDKEKSFNEAESFDNFFKKVKSISFNNKYALWIVQRYLDNGIQRYEDLGRTETALFYYHKYKNRLEEKDRNIMNIKSLVDLENLVEPFSELDRKKELEKLQKEKIYSETKFIYDGPEGKIVVPLTLEASIFWGQGTRWCTSSLNNNMFDYYNKLDPLYIFILPEKDKMGRELKYQLHVHSKQFMNYNDYSVNKADFSQNMETLLLKWFTNLEQKEKLIHIKTVFKKNKYEYENDYDDVEKYHFYIKQAIMDYVEKEHNDLFREINENLKYIENMSNKNFQYRKKYNTLSRFFPAFMTDNDFKKQQMLHLENVLKKYDYVDPLWTIRINQKAFHQKFNDIFEKAVDDGLALDYIPEKFISSRIIKKSLHHIQEYNTDLYEKYMNKEIAEYILINFDITKLFDLCHMKSSVWNKDYYILKKGNTGLLVDIISNNINKISENNLIFFQFLLKSRFEENENNNIYQKFIEILSIRNLNDNDYANFFNTNNMFDMYKIFPLFKKSFNLSEVNYENFVKNFDMIFNKTGLYNSSVSYYIFDINNKLIEFDIKNKNVFISEIKNLIAKNPKKFFTMIKDIKIEMERFSEKLKQQKIDITETEKQHNAIIIKQKEIFFCFVKNINVYFSTEDWEQIIKKSTNNNIMNFFVYEDYINIFPGIGNGLREFATKSKLMTIKDYYKHIIDEKIKTHPVAIPMILHDVDSLIKLAQEYKNK